MKLSEICEVYSGYALKSFNDIEDGLPVVKIGNILTDGTLNLEECQYTTDSVNQKYYSKKGDIYIALSGATTGKIGIMDAGKRHVINQRVGIVRQKSDDIPQEYIKYFLLRQADRILQEAAGCAQPNISPKQIAEYVISETSKEKMQKICGVLNGIKKIIDSRKAEISALDNLIKARFVEMFGDVKYGTERWGGKPFKDITINLDSKRKPVKDADRKKMQGIYPYYGATGIVDYVNDYRQDGEFLLISEDGKALELRSKPIAFLASGKIWVNNHAHVQQCTDECNMVYLMYHINFMDISIWVTGIDQKKLNRANLDTIPIALPPIELQEQFADFVKQVNKSKVAVQKALDETKSKLKE